MSVKLYGLRNCDTCRKAEKSLSAKGLALTFIDVRSTPLEAADLERFLARFGESLINKRSTTWRNLSENDRSLPELELLKQNPAVMKRPVIDSGQTLHLGWSKDVQAALSG